MMKKVRISIPTKSSMQSGRGSDKWAIELLEDTSSRSIEQRMGWTSSKDMSKEIRLEFPNCESATLFAQENGWEYEVVEPASRKFIKKSYADNFK